ATVGELPGLPVAGNGAGGQNGGDHDGDGQRLQLLFIDGDWFGSGEDGSMPGEADLAAIKKFAENPDVRIVFLGVKEDATSQFILRENRGRHYFLLKPFHLSEIVSIYSRMALRPRLAESGAPRSEAGARVAEPAVLQEGRPFPVGPNVLI